MKKIVKNMVWGIIIAIPAIAYVMHFHGHAISDDPAMWGSFGDYFGGIYSVIVTIFAVILANKLAQQADNKRREKSSIIEIENQIQIIEKGEKIDMRRVNRLYRLVKQSSIFLPDDLYQSIINLADHFLECKDNKDDLDKNFLKDVKSQLKRLYRS